MGSFHFPLITSSVSRTGITNSEQAENGLRRCPGFCGGWSLSGVVAIPKYSDILQYSGYYCIANVHKFAVSNKQVKQTNSKIMETTANMQATRWSIDPMHSEIHFKVKHLLISTVTGSFKSVSGWCVCRRGRFWRCWNWFHAWCKQHLHRPGHAWCSFKVRGIFDTENYPQIKFQSTSFKRTAGDHYLLAGNLTMKGITKPITINAEFGGLAKTITEIRKQVSK